MTKYLDPPSVGTGTRPQISECIRLKGAEEKELLSLKEQFCLFVKMTGSTMKFFKLSRT